VTRALNLLWELQLQRLHVYVGPMQLVRHAEQIYGKTSLSNKTVSSGWK